MRLRLYFYCFSKEDVENVKRTDQLGPTLDYEKVGTRWIILNVSFQFFSTDLHAV